MASTVSIVIPCYNQAEYVADSLNAALNQDYENIELIIVDDGSVDGSSDIIDQYANKRNVKIIRNQINSGVSVSLNSAIAVCSGKYISVCAADDILLPNKISDQVAVMDSNPDLVFCYGQVEVFGMRPEMFNYHHIFEDGLIFPRLLVMGNWIAAHSILFRKEFFDKTAGFDPRLRMEDWDVWLQLAAMGPVAYQDKVVARYRQHANNHQHPRNIKRIYQDRMLTLNKWRDNELYELAWFMKCKQHLSEISPELALELFSEGCDDQFIKLLASFSVAEKSRPAAIQMLQDILKDLGYYSLISDFVLFKLLYLIADVADIELLIGVIQDYIQNVPSPTSSMVLFAAADSLTNFMASQPSVELLEFVENLYIRCMELPERFDEFCNVKGMSTFLPAMNLSYLYSALGKKEESIRFAKIAAAYGYEPAFRQIAGLTLCSER